MNINEFENLKNLWWSLSVEAIEAAVEAVIEARKVVVQLET